jgi:3-oxoadipate CoA-transferase alpha subunit
VLPAGSIDPESVVTPGIYVDAVVPIDSTTVLAGAQPAERGATS